MVGKLERSLSGFHVSQFFCRINSTGTFHVKMTLFERCYDVKTVKLRRNNVVLTSCAGWEAKLSKYTLYVCFNDIKVYKSASKMSCLEQIEC